MADMTITRPAAGQNVVLEQAPGNRLVFDFPTDQAMLDRVDDNLVLTFDDGSTVTLQDFYTAYTKDTLPEFVIDGGTVPGEEFFAALGENLMPAAGPAAAPAAPDGAGSGSSFGDVGFLGGIDRLNGLDIGFPMESEVFETLEGAGNQGTPDAPAGLDLAGLTGTPGTPGAGVPVPGTPSVPVTPETPSTPETPPVTPEPPVTPNAAPVLLGFEALTVEESGVFAGGNELNPGVPTTSGRVLASDPEGDALDYGFVAPDGSLVTSLTTPYGTITMGPDGTYTYTLSNDAANSLALGENPTEEFTIFVRDSAGNVTTATDPIVVTIEGTNDRPTLELTNPSLTLTEDDAANNTATGSAVGADDDNGAKLTYDFGTDADGKPILEIADEYGKLTINPETGEYTYTLDSTSDAVQGLDHDQTVTQTVTIRVVDEHGAYSEQELKIAIKGNNDAPEITNVTRLDVVESGVRDVAGDANAVFEGKPVDVTGKITASDPDSRDGGEGDRPLTYFLTAGEGETLSTSTNEAGQTLHTLTNAYGTLTLNTATGEYAFTLNNESDAVQSLTQDEKRELSFNVGVSDQQNATGSSSIVVGLTGTNDRPVLSVSNTDLGLVEGGTSVEGTFAVVDADADGAIQTLSVKAGGDTEGTANNPDQPGQTAGFTTAYGTLAVDPATGKYTFTLNNDSEAVHKLAQGETRTETFTITTTDAHGATSEQTITVTITGTNDAPVITPRPDQILNVTESGVLDGGNIATAGKEVSDPNAIDASDIDSDPSGFTYFFRAADGTEQNTMFVVKDGNGGYRLVAEEPADNAHLGTLKVDVNGNYTFALNNANGDVNGLAQGDTLTIPGLEVFVKDALGASSEQGQGFGIQITGTNDAPALELSEKAFSFTAEDSVSKLEGNLTIADNDRDGSEQTLSIKGGDATDGTANNPGQPGTAADFTTAYGKLVVDPVTGKYSYELNNASEAVQKLHAGEDHTETFTITTTDAHGATSEQTITVTITGTNDAPVLGNLPKDLFQIVEKGVKHGGNEVENGSVYAKAELAASDIDGDKLTPYIIDPATGNLVQQLYVFWDPTAPDGYRLSATTPAWNEHIGSFQVSTDANGKLWYAFHVEQNSVHADKMTAHTVFDITGIQVVVKDEHGAVSNAKEYGVHFQGTNDKPDLIIDGSRELTITEDGPSMQVEGTFHIKDPDADGAIQTISIKSGSKETVGEETPAGGPNQAAAFETPYGKLVVDPATGKYTFVLNNDSKVVQQLGEGESHTETFTITTVDEHGAYDSETITVVIKGTNDAPVITTPEHMLEVKEPGVKDGGNIDEPGYRYVTGQADVTDIDGDKLTNFFYKEDGVTHTDKMYVVLDPSAEGGYRLVDSITWPVNTHIGTLMADANTPGKFAFHLNYDHPAINSLPSGTDITLKGFEMYVKDEHGAVSNAQVYGVVIKGTNDKPTLDFVTGNGLHNVVDTTDIGDATAANQFDKVAGGALQAADVDRGDTKTYSISYRNPLTGEVTEHKIPTDQPGYTIDTAYGKLVFAFGADGKVTYEFQLNTGYDGKIHEMSKGDLVTEYFTLTVTDKLGANATQKVYIDLNGSNDAPWVTPDQGDSWKTTIFEDMNATKDGGLERHEGDEGFERTVDISGKLLASDAEGDKITFSLVAEEGSANAQRTLPHIVTDANGVQHEIGYITLKPDGSYTYTLFNDNAYVQQMGANTSIDAKFWVRVSDGNGGVTYKELTVTVKGANDTPHVSDGDSTVKEDGGLVNPGDDPNLTVKGKVTATDLDSSEANLGNARFVLTGDGVSEITVDGVLCTQKTTDYGTLTLWPDGNYTYTLNSTTNDGMQGVHEGDIFGKEQFSFEVTTGLGQETDASQSIGKGNINIKIEGTNDAPIIETDVDGDAKIFDPASTKISVSGEVHADDKDESTSQGDDRDDLSFRFMNKYDGNDNPEDANFNDTTGQEKNPDQSWQAEQTIKGEFGSITINPDGTYTYTLDVFSNVVKGFPVGHEFNETFRVTVTDHHGATHTVDLNITIPRPDFSHAGSGGVDTWNIKINGTDALQLVESSTDGRGTAIAKGKVDYDLTVDCNHEGDGHQGDAIANSGHVFFAFLVDGQYVQTISNQYGAVTINPLTGEYTYTLNDASRYVQELPEGYELQLPPFTVHVVNGDGNPVTVDGKPATADITGKITGTNDAPIVDSLDNLVVTDGTEGADSGTVKAHDTDKDLLDRDADGNTAEREPLTYSYSYNGESVEVGVPVKMAYGTFTLNADGTYTYVLDAGNAAVDALGKGQTMLDSGLTVTISDGVSVDNVTRPIGVTITGKNDDPTLTFADAAGNANDGSFVFTEDSGTATLSGKAVGADVDKGDTLHYSMELVGGGKSSYILSGDYGTMVLDPVSGDYKYLLDNERPAVQGLGAGESHTETYKITVTDQHGGSHTETITVTINGVDDRAEVTLNQKTTSVTENDATIGKPVNLGNITVKDIDVNDHQTLSLKGGEDGETVWQKGGAVDMAGKYGTLTLNADGTYAYTLNSHELGQGVKYTESFTIVVKEYDSKGNFLGETEHTVTVRLTGSNDAPTITGGTDASLDAGDAAHLTFTGKVIGDDVDIMGTDAAGNPIHQDLTFSFTYNGVAVTAGQTIATTYGSLSVQADGTYTYTIDPDKAATFNLAEGQTITDKGLSVIASDGTAKSPASGIEISITGTNDAPVITGGTSHGFDAADSSNAVFNGQVLATDVDGIGFENGHVVHADLEYAFSYNGRELVPGETVDAKYGTLTVHEDGSYTYTLDPSLDSVKALGDGVTGTDDAFKVNVSDSLLSTDQDITITVTGSNDAPEVTAITSEPVPTEDGSLVFNGQVSATDPEGDAVSYSIADGGDYGHLSINENGEFTYSIDNPPVDGEGTPLGIFHENITVDVTDSNGAVTSVTFDAVFGVDQDSAVSYEPSADSGIWYSPEPEPASTELDQLANTLSQTNNNA